MSYGRFRRGSGVFTCTVCGKRTRDVNGSNGNLQLCALCEYKAGAGNTLSDSGYDGDDPWGLFDACKSESEVDNLLQQELDKLIPRIGDGQLENE